MAKKEKFSKTRTQILQAVQQAKDSLKILQTLEKETLAKAKNLVKMPDFSQQMERTNQKILSGLRRVGVASQSDVDALEAKVRKLEASMTKPRAPRTASKSATK